MTSITSRAGSRPTLSDALKSWMMVFLTLVFVLLYGLALIGRLKATDVSMVSRIEPIIFVIIGYYFGRLPAEQTEKTLKDEIGRQMQKADASQHAKEQALQSREALEEKIKNVNAALSSVNLSTDDEKASSGRGDSLRSSVGTALKILQS